MKKKLLLAGATLLLVAAAVTGFAAYERSNMSDLMDANVEALARNEGDTFNCASGCGGDYCGVFTHVSGNSMKVYYCY